MTILSKDGKPYRTFSEPNPIVSEQLDIKKDKLVLHNLNWEDQVVKNVPKPKVEKSKPVKEKIIPPQRKEEIDDFMELLKKEAKTIKEMDVVTPQTIEKEVDPENVLIVHCQPAIVREKKDEFYGEVKKTIQYLERKDFEARIVEWSDVEIYLFTKEDWITMGSIIYPSKYKDGQKLELYRWWRVKKIQPIKDGFLIWSEITDYQVDFS